MNTIHDPLEFINNRFSEENILTGRIEKRDYPEETFYIVTVPPDDIEKASKIGNALDRELAEHGLNAFVTVREIRRTPIEPLTRLAKGVADPRTKSLINLITSRSRTSEIQPSLSYIPDTNNNIQLVPTQRHHLIFGRRGAGKTALMVEAKKRIEEKGYLSVWINLHTYRHENANRALLWIYTSFCEMIQTFYIKKDQSPSLLKSAVELRDKVEHLIAEIDHSERDINRLIPRMRGIIRRFLDTNSTRLYIFLDDLHYLLPRKNQPILLDMLHGSIRDCDAWLKIAGIKHLSNWFQDRPPLGLQTGDDADHIDLGVTLENPSEAKIFLERVLRSYVKNETISSLPAIFHGRALDRLVLASGAVPRDYLVLSAAAIRQAQRRERARLVGVQDVNKAAGDLKNAKISELEEDAASADEKITYEIIRALETIREFCIDEKSSTFFRIDFHDKERFPNEYSLMQDLLDLRLIHLVDASLSDERRAGHRSEVYMLDLSQFSGQRLKRKLKVLDFESGNIVMKETGTNAPKKIGNTPRKRLGILRRGPLFELINISSTKK